MNKILGNYILKEELGAGQFGAVYHSYDLKNNDEYAIKTINITKLTKFPQLLSLIQNEITVLSKIDNPNIIRLKESIQKANNYYLVYEYCNGGTLETYISKKKHLSEKEALSFFQQIIHGFKSLFINKVLHRDLKPANILLHNGIIKIADFGFCKPLEDQFDLTKTMVGSPIYMAPEILKGEIYNTKADIWSMGVVLFEMLFGYCPYEDRTIYRLLTQINEKPLTIPPSPKISKKTEDLLFKLLVVQPLIRIDWGELLNYNLDYLEKETIVEVEKFEKLEFNGETQGSAITKSFTEDKSNMLKSFNEISENNSKMDLKYFLKQRNKGLMILRTIDSLLNPENIAFLESHDKNTLINCLFENFLKNYDDLIYDLTSGIKKKENSFFDEQADLSELKGFLQTIKHEKKIFESTIGYFRKEKKINYFLQENFLVKKIIEKLFLKLKEYLDNNHYKIRSDLIISVFLLDCFQINEILSIFFQTNTKYTEQSYIKSIETLNNGDLFYIFAKKMSQISWMK